MKHHFADLLDRSVGYWTITPNQERWAGHFDDLADAPADVSRLMLTRDDRNWHRVRDFKNLVELTLHQPSQEQLTALAEFPRVTALRISHARPKTLDMLRAQTAVRELVFEYVSGVKDLQPVGALPALTALHIENMRNVTDFSGLGSLSKLRYLSIDGTLDWKQPILSFDFLNTLPNLEHVVLRNVRAPNVSMPLAALADLEKLARLAVAMDVFPLDVFAWIEANFPHVEGAVRPAYVRYGPTADRRLGMQDERSRMPLGAFMRLPGMYVGKDGNRYQRLRREAILLGKGERLVFGTEEHVAEKCRAHAEKYRQLVEEQKRSR